MEGGQAGLTCSVGVAYCIRMERRVALGVVARVDALLPAHREAGDGVVPGIRGDAAGEESDGEDGGNEGRKRVHPDWEGRDQGTNKTSE